MSAAASADIAIRTESLTKIYDGRHIALNCVDLEVSAGTVLGILGQNGAGKTTLVRLLLGLHVPTAGRAYVLGRRMTPNAAALRRRIGYMPAESHLPDRQTPIGYLDHVGRLGGVPRGVRRPRLASLLRAVNLLDCSGDRLRTLSTGMKTRLALAASLINDPELLIWDEPAQGLDPHARRSMLELMDGLAQSKTIVLCSHHVHELREVCDDVLVLNEGQIIFNGPLEDLEIPGKPSDIEITLLGDRKAIADVVRSIAEFEELADCKLTKNVLRLKVIDETSHATALANVLVTLADNHIEMSDLRIAGHPTEDALADLVVREKSRGLVRAGQSIAGVADAASAGGRR